MKKEFNLSEKRYWFSGAKAYCEEDVKEFINILKDELYEIEDLRLEIRLKLLEKINKFAGNKLKDKKELLEE